MNWRTRFRYILWPRISRPIRSVLSAVSRRFTIYRVAFLLVISALAIWYFAAVDVDDLWPNIIPELLSIAITVFIIDTIYRRHSDDQAKKILITQLGSRNNAVATEALTELEARGWLSDGTLRGVFLLSANLDENSFTGADLRGTRFPFASLRKTAWMEADLREAWMDGADLEDATLSMHATGQHYAEADLRGASMSEVNMRGARVRDEQLVELKSLWRATMPDGKLYDGRFNLPVDQDIFLKSSKDPDDPNGWASFYGVSVEEYQRGQRWAKARAQQVAENEPN